MHYKHPSHKTHAESPQKHQTHAAQRWKNGRNAAKRRKTPSYGGKRRKRPKNGKNTEQRRTIGKNVEQRPPARNASERAARIAPPAARATLRDACRTLRTEAPAARASRAPPALSAREGAARAAPPAGLATLRDASRALHAPPPLLPARISRSAGAGPHLAPARSPASLNQDAPSDTGELTWRPGEARGPSHRPPRMAPRSDLPATRTRDMGRLLSLRLRQPLVDPHEDAERACRALRARARRPRAPPARDSCSQQLHTAQASAPPALRRPPVARHCATLFSALRARAPPARASRAPPARSARASALRALRCPPVSRRCATPIARCARRLRCCRLQGPASDLPATPTLDMARLCSWLILTKIWNAPDMRNSGKLSSICFIAACLQNAMLGFR